MNRVAPPIQVDRNSPVPLYFQVAQHLEHLIESGELAPGTRLENEIDLADRLGLSRPTMRRAIEYLVDKGLLVRKRGVGTQVVHAKVQRQVELTSLYDDLAKARRDPHTRVLSFATEPAPDALALELGIPEGTEVYVFERLRYAGAEPLAIMRNHVPADLLRLVAGGSRGTGAVQPAPRERPQPEDREAVDRGPRRHRRRGPGAGRNQGSATADHGALRRTTTRDARLSTATISTGPRDTASISP